MERSGARSRSGNWGQRQPCGARTRSQAEPRLAGTSCSAPAELSPASGGGAPGSQCAGAQPAQVTRLPAGMMWAQGQRAQRAPYQAPPFLPRPTEGRCKRNPTNCRENLERRSSRVPASPHPQVNPEREPGSRRVFGAVLAECRCTPQMVIGRDVIFPETGHVSLTIKRGTGTFLETLQPCSLPPSRSAPDFILFYIFRLQFPKHRGNYASCSFKGGRGFLNFPELWKSFKTVADRARISSSIILRSWKRALW